MLNLLFLAALTSSYNHNQVTEIIQQRSVHYRNPLTELQANKITENVIKNTDKISPHIIIALIEVESKYDLRAQSHKKCKGLMQLHPKTAKNIAKKLGLKTYNVWKIEDNILIGVYYLYFLLQKHKSIGKALTIYNMGLKNYLKNGKKLQNTQNLY